MSADSFNPPHGVALALAPGVRRIVAPNPSPMTFRGTNTYLVGTRGLAVIDPGPMNDVHLKAVLSALEPGQHISHIIVTHTHLDHSPLASVLSERVDAPVVAFGSATAGRSSTMQRLSETGYAGGGEGIDHDFEPDIRVEDGARIQGDDWALDVIHTPGHLGNHICLGLNDMCFTADHVMGWASSLVSPPDGDLTDFMASCRKLQATNWRRFFPGHGAPIEDPASRLEWLLKHRNEREAAVLHALRAGHGTASEITAQVYQDTPQQMWPAAERNVLAHLIDLVGRALVEVDGSIASDSRFTLRENAPE